MNKFLQSVLVLSLCSVSFSSFSQEKMSKEECKEFLVYQGYQAGVLITCGELKPAEVAEEHKRLLKSCTKKIGDTQSIPLLEKGFKSYQENLSMTISKTGKKEDFCQIEANMVSDTLKESNSSQAQQGSE